MLNLKIKNKKNDSKKISEEIQPYEIEEVKKDELTGLIDTTPIECIYPFMYRENKDSVELGGNYIKVIAIAQYPTEARGNWLSDLKRLKGNISITQYIQTANDNLMLDHYNRSIKNKQAELLKTKDPRLMISLEEQIKSAENQLRESFGNKVGFLYIYTYILIQAETPEKLNRLEESVQRALMKAHMRGIIPYYRMGDAYWSALPLQQNKLQEYTYQMSNTTAASSFFPFDDSEVCDLSPNAVIEGINKITNSVVSINYLDEREETLNQNMIVIGTSGVGKTSAIMRKILNLIARGYIVYVIDPENEYSDIIEYYGGTVIHLSSISDTKINLLEIFSEEITDDEIIKNMTASNKVENLIKQKCQRLKALFKTIKEDMTQVEMSIVEKLVISLYDKFREVQDISKMTHKDFPILEDLYNRIGKLKEEDPGAFNKIEDFYYILNSYVYGSNSIFNGYTNVSLNNSIISFDLKALQNEPEIQGACYLNTFSYLWDIITSRKNHKYTYMFIDEFHFLTKNPQAIDFFFQAYKRFRKYNASAVAITQQIQDILKKEIDDKNLGEAVVGNSYTKLFFGLDNRGVDEVIEKLRLNFSKPEISLLRAKRKGEALLLYGTKRVFMRIELSREEMRLINPKRYRKNYEQNPDVEVDYESQLHISPMEMEEIKNLGEWEL
ncbi:VirB4 family type IV secretion system protein [Clostridium sp. WILCCON 0269]|uniref:VirB4 family type IV secretion system protein n=1 Tax=Candidatus Clostridium eludens TaxID=3381663 RepID=A0ABW8SPN1_9CLOT